MIQVRTEIPEDIEPIRELTIEAFRHSELGYQGEANLIDAIRAAHQEIISLVAVHEDGIIGHIMSSPATLEWKHGTMIGTAIGPVSVLPSWQGKQVGSTLILSLISKATDMGCPFVAVAGHPTYYPRFGFRVLKDFGLRHCFRGMRDEIFFIRFLVNDGRSDRDHGILKYCAEFGPQDRLT